ncbi:hypothetical protein QBC43DRAFT_312792 [Cladorrhinum sp. PSN259]|nr:hypothetical protein QBC43DRAFT_312792 [Cladorrhinum sp. PSN259]
MEGQDLDINELAPSLRKRFYEPLILLYCFCAILARSQNSSKPPDLESGDDKSPAKRFECFVNKLGQVCDRRRGGDTVTAFAILQTGCVEYRFAVNRLDDRGLAETAQYVKDLLNTLGSAPRQTALEAKDRQDSTLFSSVMHKILAFNQSRISFYINSQLLKNLEFCIGVCQEAGQDGDLAAASDLLVLKDLAGPAGEDGVSPSEFATRTHELLKAISQLYRQDRFRDYMSEKTREDREGAIQTPWTELFHGIGRLESYSITVKVFLAARHRWPELFEHFQVSHIPTTEPADTPSIRRSCMGIIKRLTTDPTVLDAFNAHANAGQSDFVKELDKEIAKRVKPKNFQPIVHAEVNLSNDIIQDERHPQSVDGDRVRFYNEANFGRYIGCSKPSCRLCELYFQAPSGPNMRVRSGHHNLYYNWRAPDLDPQDGSAGAAARNKVLEWMVQSIKAQAAQTIKQRFAMRNPHDSNTIPSNPLTTDYSVITMADGANWDMVSTFGQMGLGPGQSRGADDGEDGGAKL